MSLTNFKVLPGTFPVHQRSDSEYDVYVETSNDNENICILKWDFYDGWPSTNFKIKISFDGEVTEEYLGKVNYYLVKNTLCKNNNEYNLPKILSIDIYEYYREVPFPAPMQTVTLHCHKGSGLYTKEEIISKKDGTTSYVYKRSLAYKKGSIVDDTAIYNPCEAFYKKVENEYKESLLNNEIVWDSNNERIQTKKENSRDLYENLYAL